MGMRLKWNGGDAGMNRARVPIKTGPGAGVTTGSPVPLTFTVTVNPTAHRAKRHSMTSNTLPFL
jgi:hypothetical protein